ncbi:Hsp20/alpha crystallin family protein [Aneurinibacillus tyrosinisolvens]|uniref:Hsp20/alpha crystallin family protein n=1 Tax=Aneurinibacillus tyrosinisolvens TaxID=1443435 RepID=UPI00063F60BD|nr:Hsp20/alpha crystallin family protein [Aneurinibacillus tyrosinisolvens]
MKSKHISNQQPENVSNTDLIHIEQKGSEMVIQAKLPGAMRKEIKVEISNDLVSIITGSPPERILKTVRLPVNVDAEKTKATYDDNVLTVSIPLRSPEQMSVHIWHTSRVIPIEGT